MTDIIERAEAALVGVTDGPWVVDIHEDSDYDRITVGSGEYLTSPENYLPSDLIHEVVTYGDESDYAQVLGDALFIAAARALVPELLAELKAARAAQRLIESVEQLEALPPESIIKTSGGSVACRFYDRVHGVVFGYDRPFKWGVLASELPAILLWEPK